MDSKHLFPAYMADKKQAGKMVRFPGSATDYVILPSGALQRLRPKPENKKERLKLRYLRKEYENAEPLPSPAD